MNRTPVDDTVLRNTDSVRDPFVKCVSSVKNFLLTFVLMTYTRIETNPDLQGLLFL